MLDLTMKMAKEGFFDRKKVIDAVDRAAYRVSMKYGLAVRRRAQKSLVYGDRPSRPGTPPTAHKSHRAKKTSKKTGKVRFRNVSPLRDKIIATFDTSTKSVVIGPTRFESAVSTDARSALEHGGTSTIIDRGKTKRVDIKARPFMRPAGEAERPGLRDLWKNSVR